MRALILACAIQAALSRLRKPSEFSASSTLPHSVVSTSAADALLAVIQESPVVKFDEFLPQCVGHLKGLLRTVKAEYTEIQLEEILETECDRVDAFPKTASAGFKKTVACNELATKLAKARHEQLKTESEVPLESWCEEYYVHAIGPVKPPPPPKKQGSGAWKVIIGAVIVAAVAVVGTYYLTGAR